MNPSKLYENHMNKAVLNDLEAIYKIVVATDTLVLIIGQDGPRSVTNDAQRAINRIAADLGGLRQRRIFCRDSGCWFTVLHVEAGEFKGFSPCIDHLEEVFAYWCQEAAQSQGRY